MKKLLTILLSLAMVLSMGSVAFADEIEPPYDIESTEDGNNSVDINVYAKYVNGEIGNYIGDPTYKVVVNWTMNGSIEGTKTDKKVYKWNSETFKYDVYDEVNSKAEFDYNENESGDRLDHTTVDITVTNKSDGFVIGEIKYVPVADESNNPYSMIGDGYDNTDSFNTEFATLVMDSIHGGFLSGRKLSDFEDAVFGLYTVDADEEEGTVNAIAAEAYEAEYFENIDGLIEWLKADADSDYYTNDDDKDSSLACPFADKFNDLLPNGSDASTLLSIFLDESDTLNPENSDNHSIINPNLRFTYSTGEQSVYLTDKGKNYILTQTENQKEKVGCFTVTVTAPNIG